MGGEVATQESDWLRATSLVWDELRNLDYCNVHKTERSGTITNFTLRRNPGKTERRNTDLEHRRSEVI